MIKKVLLLVLVLLLATVVYTKVGRDRAEIDSYASCLEAGNPVVEFYPRQCWTKNGKHFVEKVSDQMGESVTLKGEITCLPKDGDGPQTMECALGLLAEDGYYYSFANLSELGGASNLTGGQKVEVTGTIYRNTKNTPDGNRNNRAGNIILFSVTDQ